MREAMISHHYYTAHVKKYNCSYNKSFVILLLKQNIRTSFKLLNYRLLFAILITFLVPAILQTVRMHFIGGMLNPQSYSIAANLQ